MDILTEACLQSGDDTISLVPYPLEFVSGPESASRQAAMFLIFADCPIPLDPFEETGRTVLRVIIPDKYEASPENENCMDA